LKNLIEKIRVGHHLTSREIETVMKAIMQGSAKPDDVSDFLLALNEKGPSVEEITTAARIMRKFVVEIKTSHPVVLDTCGTGGDGKETFNISTAAALVVAGAGVVIAKHGNRSVSSRCGSACVLEALGVNLAAEEDRVSECLDKAGIAFLFAQRLHPAMKNVAPIRKALKVKTIFNILGPLTNPARATHQVMGVYNRDLVAPMAHVLKNLGLRRALVVHGSDGLDEITTTGKTFVSEFNGREILSYDIEVAELGITPASENDLKGGSIDENAAIIRRILDGKAGPQRDIVVLNAAYGLYTAERAGTISEAVKMASASINTGGAKKKLQQLVEITNG
jgi:anthranilate phosphoribosyltransferase